LARDLMVNTNAYPTIAEVTAAARAMRLRGPDKL
jgi:hypothetical protein